MRKKPADTGKNTSLLKPSVQTRRNTKKNKQNSTKQLKNNKTHVQTDAYTVQELNPKNLQAKHGNL